MSLPQSEKLTLHLQVATSLLLEALQELLPQAHICFTEDIKACDGILHTTPNFETVLPSLDFSSLPKPLRFLDLLALLNNLPYTHVVTFKHFSLDIREKNLTNLHLSKEYRLTGKECDLLRFFYQNANLEVPKEKLLKEIWQYHPDTTTHTLETHIYRLRQKLEENPTSPQILVNCKDGYILRI